MKTTIKVLRLVVILAVIAFSIIPTALAAQWVTAQHVVKINVPDALAITADTTDITLTMPSYVSGSISNQVTVTYTVTANSMSQADGAAAININLDNPYDRINLQAKAGTYTKVSGNTSLVAVGSAFVNVPTTNLAIANKTASTGDGKVLNGKIPVTYQAVASADVPTGQQIHNLLVTLTTI